MITRFEYRSQVDDAYNYFFSLNVHCDFLNITTPLRRHVVGGCFCMGTETKWKWLTCRRQRHLIQMYCLVIRTTLSLSGSLQFMTRDRTNVYAWPTYMVKRSYLGRRHDESPLKPATVMTQKVMTQEAQLSNIV